MSESELYPAVERFLNVQFGPSLKPKHGAHLTLVAITATFGAAVLGTWSRPDLAMVDIWRYKYQPTQTLDVHGIEVKRNEACDLRSVHETLAHTRLVHLVWNYRDGNFDNDRFCIIAENCKEYGLGLITFQDSDNGESFKVHLSPERRAPSEAAVNEFIDTRFSTDQQNRLLKWLGERR